VNTATSELLSIKHESSLTCTIKELSYLRRYIECANMWGTE